MPITYFTDNHGRASVYTKWRKPSPYPKDPKDSQNHPQDQPKEELSPKKEIDDDTKGDPQHNVQKEA